MYAGKVVLISGGAGGIGSALARRFGQDGARIVLTDRAEEELLSVVESLVAAGVEAIPLVLDITGPEACGDAVAAAVARFGGVDVLIHSAGLTQVGPFEKNDIDVYRRVMDVNFFGPVHLTKAALPALIERKGQIVVFSSIAGFAPLLGRTGYCASKYALHGFFDTLRCELDHHGVGVLLVCPSFVDTAFAASGLGTDGKPLRFNRTTLGKLTSPESVAEAVYQAACRRKRQLVIGATGRVAWWVSRLFPGYYARQMTRRFELELRRPPNG